MKFSQKSTKSKPKSFDKQAFKRTAKIKAKQSKILSKYNVNDAKKKAISEAFKDGDLTKALAELKAKGLLTDKEIQAIQNTSSFKQLLKNPEVAKQALASIAVVLFSKNIFDIDDNNQDQSEEV